MIPRTAAARPTSGSAFGPPPRWQRSLAEAIASVGELLDALGLDAGRVDASLEAHCSFPLRVPRGFVGRMRPGDPRDPLLLQVLPSAAELAAAPGFGRLRAAGVTLLNQAVLLRGVNDDASTLAELGESLTAAGVVPYYLNLLYRVAGTAHFEVCEARARRLVGELAACTSGYLVPRLVREVPGAPAKMPMMPDYGSRATG